MAVRIDPGRVLQEILKEAARMDKRGNRSLTTCIFTILFLFFMFFPVFSDTAAGKNDTAQYLWHLFTGSAVVGGSENVSAVVTDEAGNIFMAAEGMKWDPAQETKADYGNPGRPLHWHSGNNPINKDILVIKFGPDGEFKWYTYYGGFEEDNVRGMAIVGGMLYITGTSRDNWFGPDGETGVNEHSRTITYGGDGKMWHEYSQDIFVLALNKYSGSYKWHTFHGESNWNEEVYGIAADKERVFLVGKADAEWFGCPPVLENAGDAYVERAQRKRKNRACKPTRGYQGSNDAWVMALKADTGEYVKHTFLGGSESNDWGEAIAIDKNGMVVVAGASDQSWNYTHAWYNTPPRNPHSGGYDMFIARLARSDLELHWHAFFGGPDNDWATAVLTDDANGYYLAGYSRSGFEVKDRAPVAEHTAGVNYDFAVLKMNNEGANGWHTFRGRDKHDDVAHAMALSLDGKTLYVAGEANGPWVQGADGAPVHDFTKDSSTASGYQIDVTDMAILALDASNGKSRWHSFYGGWGHDRAYSIAVTEDEGDIIVGGTSDSGWTVHGTASKYKFPNNGDSTKQLNPNFALLRLYPYGYTIKASVKGNAGGTINPSGDVKVGYRKDQTFTFTPGTGYEPGEVLVDGKAVTIINNRYTFAKVAADHTIEIAFKKKTFTIEASARPDGGTVTPSGEVSVEYGADQEFVFAPDDGYGIEVLVVDGVEQEWSKHRYTFSNVTAHHTLKVVFAKVFIISTYVEGEGTIAPDGDVKVFEGKSQAFTFTPAEGSSVSDVVVDGISLGAMQGYTFPDVGENHTIKVVFQKQ
jgi:hypothetical protein